MWLVLSLFAVNLFGSGCYSITWGKNHEDMMEEGEGEPGGEVERLTNGGVVENP